MSVSLGLNDPDDFLCQVGGYEECWEFCRGRSSSRGGGALIFSCLDSQLRDDSASWIRPDARVSVALKEHHGSDVSEPKTQRSDFTKLEEWCVFSSSHRRHARSY